MINFYLILIIRMIFKPQLYLKNKEQKDHDQSHRSAVGDVKKLPLLMTLILHRCQVEME